MDTETKLVKIGFTSDKTTTFKLFELNSYEELVTETSRAFGQNANVLDLIWLDKDGDTISITGAKDLELFFKTASKPYKLLLQQTSVLNPKAVEFSPLSRQNTVVLASRQSSPPPAPQANVRIVAIPKLNARFVKHVTCDDETSVYAPGTKFFKTWRFRNDGQLKWPKMIRILFVSKLTGDAMGGPEDLPILFPEQIELGAEIDISVPLIAPEKSGEYTGFWKLCDEAGKKFGQRVRVRIFVDDTQRRLDSQSKKVREIINLLEEEGFDENARKTALITFRTTKTELKYDDIELRLGRLGIRQSLN